MVDVIHQGRRAVLGIHQDELKECGPANLEETRGRNCFGEVQGGLARRRDRIRGNVQRVRAIALCSHFRRKTVAGYRAYLKHLKVFFGGLMLARITTKLVEEYRDHRRQQPSVRYSGRTLKGATVNRELECLTCLLDLAVRREYIPENPARAVKHFNELRERPVKQMLTLDQENRILNAASPHLRVGIVLLVQTGGRTYTEGFRLRWDQIDWENRLIRFGNDVKTPGSSEPLPLTDLAFRVLRKWKEESKSESPFIFPSPRKRGCPIRSVKTAWRATLKRAKGAALSDLQLAACFLYSTELGSTGCHNSTGHASYKPRDKAPVSTRHGRTGSRSDGESESTGVWREHIGQLGRFS